MCLDVVEWRANDIERYYLGESKVGYKVFTRLTGGDLAFPVVDHKGNHLVSRGTWLESPFGSGFIRSQQHPKFPLYPAGFHLMLTREDAEKYSSYEARTVIRKVLYRGVLARGKQKGVTVLVVSHLFVTPGLKRKPPKKAKRRGRK